MSKRIADDQLTKDNLFNQDGEGIDNQQQQLASSEILSTRKILKPRGHLGGAGSGTNGFKGLKLPLTGLGPSDHNNSSSNPFSGFKSSPAPTPLSFGNSTITPTNNSSSIPSTNNDKNNKIKALNTKFIESLNQKHVNNTIVNFTPILQKYITYYQEIENEFKQSSQPQPQPSFKFNSVAPVAPAPVAVPSTQPSANGTKKPEKEDQTMNSSNGDESSDDDEDDAPKVTKIEGPKFTLESKPTVKKSPFSFGPKPEAKPKDDSDSDSDSEIEIKGPTFTFNKPIQDNVFKFNNPEKKPTEAPKPAFSFATNTEKTDLPPKPQVGKTDEVTKPTISFGTTTTPAFGFGSSTNNNEKKEVPPISTTAFNFGTPAPSNGLPAKPIFNFGQKKESEQPTSLFSQPATTEDKPKEVSKPFVFGSSTNSTTPTFGFGSTDKQSIVNGTTEEKKPVSFGGAVNGAPKPFTFNIPTPVTKEETITPKPVFNFGAPATSSFSFGQTSNGGENKAPVAAFGSNSANNSTTDKPFQFSFNSSNNTDNKPSLFGSSNTNTNGGGSSLFGGNAFTFKPQDKKEESVPTTDGGEEGDDDKVEEVEVEGNFTPVAALASEKIDSSTGEEGEETLYTKRAKLSLYDSKESKYTNIGLGELKILKNKDSGKSRILMRADGGLRVLFNNLIATQLTYSSLGDGSMVQIPSISSNGDLQKYVVKVKTADDGKELLKTINEQK